MAAMLWTPPTGVGVIRHRQPTVRTVTLPDGTRAKVTVEGDDEQSVTHIETGDRLDCVVRPRTVVVEIRKDQR